MAPAHLAQFKPDEWQGVSEYDNWLLWMEARGDWIVENNAPDSYLDIHEGMALQPLWTEADIARMI